jgi:amidohydrolase
MDTRKAAVVGTVDDHHDTLLEISHAIHGRPELGYEEHFAAGLLAEVAEHAGFAVERAAFGIPTSFAARAGNGPGPHVVLCCEYDALPGIGHGCGHNIIAAASLGAGLALRGEAERLGARLTVLGTPAEELGAGGKIRLLEAGAFDGVDVALMVHPSVADVAWAPHIACRRLAVRMHGKAAHAAAAPWDGVNALDGIVAAYTGIAMLRQHLRPGEKVHGIITEGGDAENIVPDRAGAVFQVRAPTLARLEPLERKVQACFEGAATQAGCRLEVAALGSYAELWYNAPLAAAYRRNGERLGRRFLDPAIIPLSVAGSTDMGNVSQVVPSLHAMIEIADLDVPGHSVAFREAAVSGRGDRAVIDGAKALAMSALDCWTDAALLEEVRHAFGHGPRRP